MINAANMASMEPVAVPKVTTKDRISNFIPMIHEAKDLMTRLYIDFYGPRPEMHAVPTHPNEAVGCLDSYIDDCLAELSELLEIEHKLVMKFGC